MPPNFHAPEQQQVRSRGDGGEVHSTEASASLKHRVGGGNEAAGLHQDGEEGGGGGGGTQLSQFQIRIQDKIYDAEKLAQFHPGGPLFISAFAGRDASQVKKNRQSTYLILIGQTFPTRKGCS